MVRLGLLVWLASCLSARAGDWPQFRGPDGTGVASDGNPPLEWGPKKNVAWKAALPGAGWSSPVVCGDKLFVTTAVSEKGEKPKNFDAGVKDLRSMPFLPQKAPDAVYRFEVHCLDRATGRTLWKQTVAEKKPGIPVHPSNTFATESPAADASRVFVRFGTVGLVACYDHSGKKLWEKDLGVYKMSAGFGTGSSLTLDAGRLFVQCDNEEKSFLTALDAASGEERWRGDRPGKSAWATPVVWKNRVRTELVSCGDGKVFSYDPATGKELWRLGNVDTAFAPSPTADAERIYFGCSSPFSTAPLYAVRAGAAGDISLKKGEKSNDGVVWHRTRSGIGMSSPVVVGGQLYLAGEATMTCYDARTGEQKYRERLPRGKMVAASAWSAGGKLFVLDESGQTFVLQPGPEFNVLGTNRLDDTFWSTPAAAGDELFLRGVESLYCVRK